MTAKKQTPAATAASKSRKAAKPKELAVATPQLETLPTLAPPVEPAPNAVTTGDVPVPADPVPPGPLADTPAVTVADQPQVETEPPAPHAAAIPESTLRLWQVRRGPEILGQVQAGTITWAKKQACKQFGDNLTVEPGTEVPTLAAATKRTEKSAKDPEKLSALDAAAQVLAETGQPMTCPELIAAMAAKGYWTSPAGKTPAATLYSALLRETTTKGDQARFVKADRGKFALRARPTQA